MEELSSLGRNEIHIYRAGHDDVQLCAWIKILL